MMEDPVDALTQHPMQMVQWLTRPLHLIHRKRLHARLAVLMLRGDRWSAGQTTTAKCVLKYGVEDFMREAGFPTKDVRYVTALAGVCQASLFSPTKDQQPWREWRFAIAECGRKDAWRDILLITAAMYRMDGKHRHLIDRAFYRKFARHFRYIDKDGVINRHDLDVDGNDIASMLEQFEHRCIGRIMRHLVKNVLNVGFHVNVKPTLMDMVEEWLLRHMRNKD